MSDKVSSKAIGAVAIVTFHQPTVDPDFIKSFCHLMDEIEGDDNIRVIVISGAKGKIFFSGYDIRLLLGVTDIAVAKGSALEVQRLMDRVEYCKKPVIGVVDGYALGGGLELLLACDLVYSSERAKFGTPEVKIGLIPAAGGVIRLPRQIGKHRAMEMILRGKVFTAREVQEMGIVNEIFNHDELIEEALKIANSIAENAPVAVNVAKECMVASQGLLDKQLELLVAEACAQCLLTEDINEGALAFVEKRKPQFTGK